MICLNKSYALVLESSAATRVSNKSKLLLLENSLLFVKLYLDISLLSLFKIIELNSNGISGWILKGN